MEWGIPESDGGAAIEGYTIAIRDAKKTMWMEVGSVGADVQRLTVRELQVNPAAFSTQLVITRFGIWNVV